MNGPHNRPKRPNYREEKWVDYDEETASWGIFGVDSGFCYGLYAGQQDAEKQLKQMEGEYRGQEAKSLSGGGICSG